MGSTFITFILIFLLIAALTRETFVFVLLYLFTGAFLVSITWIKRIIQSVSEERVFSRKIFLGERITVKINIKNKSLFPVIWMHVEDRFPPEIGTGRGFQEVISMTSRGKAHVEYDLVGYKRGYYQIGPFQAHSGDLLGLVKEETYKGSIDYLTVYPKVLPLTTFRLPSRSPLGTLKHHQPIFEDPSRPSGKREYVRGDSLRRIDWKATAVSGRMQVKLFEPSIALDTAIFLNLNIDEYEPKTWLNATEFAVVMAASIANWVVDQKQAVGLIANGVDPFSQDSTPQPVYPRKGRTQLILILECLARIQAEKTQSITQVISKYRRYLGWGTTLVIITGTADDELFDSLFQAQRCGLNPFVILCGSAQNQSQAEESAKKAGIPLYAFKHELDLAIWQK